MTDKEKLVILRDFLARINCGYMELSYIKVEGEYRYFYKKAGELLDELFPQTFDQPPSNEFQ